MFKCRRHQKDALAAYAGEADRQTFPLPRAAGRPSENDAPSGPRAMTKFDALNERSGGRLLVAFVLVLLAGLPLSVWLDLRHLSSANLGRQANDLNIAITDIRDFYDTDVVG